MHECMHAYMPLLKIFYACILSGGALPSQLGKAEKKLSKKRKKHQLDEEEHAEADRSEPSISCIFFEACMHA